MGYYNDNFNMNNNNKKVTAPLLLTHFNTTMTYLMINICFLMCIIFSDVNIPRWLLFMLRCTFWVLWSCCVVLVGGYLSAILDKNVFIVEIKKNDNTKIQK